jgi:hypothetical protein
VVKPVLLSVAIIASEPVVAAVAAVAVAIVVIGTALVVWR